MFLHVTGVVFGRTCRIVRFRLNWCRLLNGPPLVASLSDFTQCSTQTNSISRFSQRPMLVVAAEEFPPHVLVKKVPSEAGWESNRVPNEAGGTNFTMNGPMDTLLQTLAHSLNFS
ncbi:hypothetical protein Pmani_002247 [Petrolisthes manimaculis]|uniref:Uncharacterized protein n=1 Tax=Petrolisthes manimaculis TaxID=1843537 RepID=A0AAE1UNP1_9EUCA|nr:hypothetical protein Pmani_002247 [Petrolisthes manimaculis]